MWLIVAYPPGFLGFPDSGQYVVSATLDIFHDAQRPAGYPLFLRLVHHLSDKVSFTVLVQHVLGIATGLLLYKAVRRTGAPPWLGLIPAAIVFFGATGLFLEHALLADPLLAFLQAVGVYAATRALYAQPLRWPLLAGIATGISFWVKPIAISSAILIPLVLLAAAPGGARRRLFSALVSLVAVLVMICTYVGAQYYFTGYLGYERQGAWNLYARVATFVNCTTFTPPHGTRFLCPPQPLGHRLPPAYYEFTSSAPAVERYGLPWLAPISASAQLQAFSSAAIESEPFAYVKTIIGGLGRYVFPETGEGSTPPQIREEVTSPHATRLYHRADIGLYPGSYGYLGSAATLNALATYEGYTQVQGPLLIVLLVAAIGGIVCLPRPMRSAAVLFTLTALFSITLAVATDSYDARFAYPTFGPLGAGAALGAWGIVSVCVRRLRPRGVLARAQASR